MQVLRYIAKGIKQQAAIACLEVSLELIIFSSI